MKFDIVKNINLINKLVKHKGFIKYLNNTFWMFFAQVFNFFSLFVNILVARYLGPNNFGKLSYALAFVGMFSFIASLGINSILIRELVKYPEKRNKLLGTSFFLLLCSGIFAFFISSISAFLLIKDSIVRNLIIIFSLNFFFSPFYVINSYFQANVQAKKNSQVQIFSVILSSFLKLILVLLKKGIIWLMLVYLSEFIFNSLFLIFNYLKSGFKIRNWEFDQKIANNILSASWLVALSSAATFLYMRIDQIMIGHYFGSVAVGLYAAAVKLAEVWYFIPTIMCNSLFPAIVNSKFLNSEIYYKRLRALYMLLGSIAVLIVVPLVILAPWFINLFYGQTFNDSIGILRIYIWSEIGLFLTWGINSYFLSEDKLKSLFFFSFLSVLINIILNLFFIPQLGIIGAAWATLISYSIGPVIVYFIYKIKKTIKFNYERKNIF